MGRWCRGGSNEVAAEPVILSICRGWALGSSIKGMLYKAHGTDVKGHRRIDLLLGQSLNPGSVQQLQPS